MSIKLRRIRAEFLRLLGTGQPVEAGQAGSRQRYDKRLSKQIGPMVSGLRRDGLIRPVGATNASRPTRNSTVALQWLAPDPEPCRVLAEAEFASLAEHPDDRPESGPRQLELFR